MNHLVFRIGIFVSLLHGVACSSPSNSDLDTNSGAFSDYENEYYGSATTLFVSSSVGLSEIFTETNPTRFDLRKIELNEDYNIWGYEGIDARINWPQVIVHPEDELGQIIHDCGPSGACTDVRKGSWLETDGETGSYAISFYGFRKVSGEAATTELDFSNAGSIDDIQISLQPIIDKLNNKETSLVDIACPNQDYSNLRGTVRLAVNPHLADELQPYSEYGAQLYQVLAEIEVATHLQLEGDNCDDSQPVTYHFARQIIVE